MFDIQTRGSIGLLETAIRKTNAPMPKAVSAMMAFAANPPQIAPPADGELERAALDVLIAGGDPLADPTCQRLIAARNIAEALPSGTLETAIMARLVETLTAHADQIIDGFRVPFNAAAEAIEAARPDLAGLDLDQHLNVLNRGGDVATSFVAVRDGNNTIEQIVTGWIALTRLVRRSVTPHRIRIMAAVPHSELDRFKPKPSAWDLANAGYALELPTIDEYIARQESNRPEPVPSYEHQWREEQRTTAEPIREAFDAVMAEHGSVIARSNDKENWRR